MSYVFLRNWTKEQMDRAESMKFHPITKEEIHLLTFNEHRLEHYALVPRWGWDADPDLVYQGRISAGKDVSKGDEFPSHWIYHPWMGKKLRSSSKGSRAL